MNSEDKIILSDAQIEKFHNEGYLVVENILSDEEIEAFLGNEANQPPNPERTLRHHTVDPQWKYVATHHNTAGVVSQLFDGGPRIVQSMYLAKPPAPADGPEKAEGKGIALHQDNHYLPNDPNTLTACWIAMNDTDAGNGGLCVVPESHKGGLRSTHVNADDDHVSWDVEYLMRDREGKEWMQRFYSFQIDDLEEKDINKLTVPKGAAVFFKGLTIHGSYANHSKERARLAFAVHYVREGTWLTRADVQETVPVEV